MGIVTISASYGSLGGTIGPRVADRLDLRFVDRAIPVAVAQRLGVPLETAEAADDRSESGVWRLFARMATVPDFGGADALAYVQAPDEASLCRQTEAVMHEIAGGSGGVVLGRAAAVVLADTPGALHVRLDGPRERRIRGAAERRGITVADADREAKDSDSAREAYVHHFYKRDGASSALYHLMIDTTAFDAESAVELIVGAARVRFAGTAEHPEG